MVFRAQTFPADLSIGLEYVPRSCALSIHDADKSKTSNVFGIHANGELFNCHVLVFKIKTLNCFYIDASLLGRHFCRNSPCYTSLSGHRKPNFTDR